MSDDDDTAAPLDDDFLFLLRDDYEPEEVPKGDQPLYSIPQDLDDDLATWQPLPEDQRLPSVFWDFAQACRDNPSYRYWCAPMVAQSELAFRMLTRRHGCGVASTPMIPAAPYCRDGMEEYRKQWQFEKREDGPVVAQFCGDKPDELLAAAKLVEHQCDAVELNLGCPVPTAKSGHYGAFLMPETQLVARIVRTLTASVRVPVLVKTRIFDDYADTCKLASAIIDSGAKVLTIHARTRQELRSAAHPARWPVIKRLVQDYGDRCAIVANGNIRELADADRCLNETGVCSVMSACGLLAYPYLFDPKEQLPYGLKEYCLRRIDASREYVECAELYRAEGKQASKHLFTSLPPSLLKSMPELRAVLLSMAKMPIEERISPAVFEQLRMLLDKAKGKAEAAGNVEEQGAVCRYWARGWCTTGGDGVQCIYGHHAVPQTTPTTPATTSTTATSNE